MGGIVYFGSHSVMVGNRWKQEYEEAGLVASVGSRQLNTGAQVPFRPFYLV